MEQHQEQKNENNGLGVDVNTQTYITGNKKDSKKALEDTNCNLTILRSKSGDLLANVDLIKSCENKLSELSLNGPTKLSNGIENVHYVESDCSIDNANSKDNSSQCETCVKASETSNDTDKINPVDDNKSEVDHSLVNEPFLCVNICPEVKPPSACLEKPLSPTDISLCESTQASSVHLDSSNVCTSAQDDTSYVSYESELQMPDIMRLIQKDLSEPYSIYTYRYFIHNWPQLCFLVSYS